MMSTFLVYAQIDGGSVNDMSLQCLARARQLADASGGSVTAVAIGSGLGEAPTWLFRHGADTVRIADDARFETYVTTPYKNVMKSIAGDFDAILFPASTVGDDLAPVLAAELNAACVIGGTLLDVTDGALVVKRPEYDRKVMAAYGAAGGLLIATLKDGVAVPPAADDSRSGETTAIDASAAGEGGATVIRRDVTAKSVNLKDARIVVGAGAGVGSQENFAVIRELADALGAELGATRAVVDAGWLPADHQIGQTGATVRPDLYIGCGISGAVQHWVGMEDSKTIVAINIDKNAPLMKRAHYRVAGDLNTVVPQLIKLIKA
jgi:electron transfer flavoprotein alpha subunit